MKIKILIFGLIILIFTNLGCIEKESSNFVNITGKSDKEGQSFKEEKGIIFEKLIFKDEHLSGEISKNKFKKTATVDMTWYINDTEEWVDFFGEKVTAVPFIVNYACGFLALAFFNESALNELQESGNVSIDRETEKDPFEGYTFTKVSIIFKDKETDEKIAECVATGPNWEDISFKVYRDYSGKPSFFGMEIGKIPEEITTYPDENVSEVTTEVTKESSYTQQSPPSEQLPIGTSRSNPFPRTGIISTQNWDIKVLEIKRGVEAWDDIKAANMFNEPPPKGWEYLLVKLWVKCTANDSEVHYNR
jgi:hypothetical protein